MKLYFLLGFIQIYFTYTSAQRIRPPAPATNPNQIRFLPLQPCDEIDELQKDSESRKYTGEALTLLENGCDAIKIFNMASNRLKGRLNSMLPSHAWGGYLRRNKPGSPESKLHLTSEWVRLESFHPFEESGEIAMKGFVKVSWHDERFRWDNSPTMRLSKSDTNFIDLHGTQMVWLPHLVSPGTARRTPSDFESDANKPADQGGVTARLYSNGTMTIAAYFSTLDVCEFDYSSYPRDTHTCCMDLQSRDYPNNARFSLNEIVARTNGIRHNAEWKLMGTSLNVIRDLDSDDEVQQLHTCVTFQRYTTTIYSETVLPLAAAICLLIFVPIFAGWKLQIYIKILALIIFILCFNALIQRTNTIGFGSSAPTIIQVYNFVIWATVVNLIVTVILWSLSKRDHDLPPPSMISKLTDVINPLCWCTQDNSELQKTQNNSDAADKNYRRDWERVCRGINNVLLMIFTIIYVVGIIMLVI